MHIQFSSTQRHNLFHPEISIEIFFILEVSALHAVPNPILPRVDWSAAYPFPFGNLPDNSAFHLHGVAAPSYCSFLIYYKQSQGTYL
jgi:hypothetical protein